MKFLLSTVPVLICSPIRMAFFFPNPVRSRSDPVARHDWVRLAAWDAHAWRISVTARVLRKASSIASEAGGASAEGCPPPETVPTAVFRREKETEAEAARAIKIHI